MIKYKAYQVNPEYQESPFRTTDYERIFIDGGRNFVGYRDEELERLKYNLALAIEDFEVCEYKEVRECVIELFDKNIVNNEIDNFIKLLKGCDKWGIEDCDILNILHFCYGGNWDTKKIVGAYQGELAYIYYDTDIHNAKSIEYIEADYFNLGTEWRIEDAENEDDNYYCYCYSWDDEALKQELADNADCAIDEIAVYKWNGYIQTPNYKEI